jgi:hypothetical protein
MRTYEPFKFLGKTPGKFMWVPLTVEPGTPFFSRTVTWEQEPPYRVAPTVVLHLGPLGIGLGWWRDSAVEDLLTEMDYRKKVEEAQARYDGFVAVYGPVDRDWYMSTRAHFDADGLDPDVEMYLMEEEAVSA